jgi:hypothetical protein
MAAIGTTLCVAGGLAIVFAPIGKKLGFYACLVGGLVIFASTVAFGYERMGEAKVQPKLDAALSQLKTEHDANELFKQQAAAAQAAAAAKIKALRAQLAAQAKTFQEKIDAQPASVAGVRIPADASRVLNGLIGDVNDSAIGPHAGDEARAAAASAVDTTLKQWEIWGGQVVTMYGQCAAQVNGLQDYVSKLAAASAAGSSAR